MTDDEAADTEQLAIARAAIVKTINRASREHVEMTERIVVECDAARG